MLISDLDRRTPISTGARPDTEATEKAARFGRLCQDDIRRALTATYAHLPCEERAYWLALDLRTAAGLAVVAGHYGLVALQHGRRWVTPGEQLRSEWESEA